MKLFSRFFPKAPTHAPTFDERIAMLDAAPADFILGTALSPDEEGLRVAAIHRLPDGQALRTLAGLAGGASDDRPAAVEQAAQTRVARLIDEGSIDFTALCAQAAGRSAMCCVAALCKDANRLAQALGSIDDPIQLAQLAVHSPSSRLRQVAAQCIEDPAQLRQLLKQVRNKDKAVYKILKQKCDALHAAQRTAAEAASEVTAACASLERHSQRSYDAIYASTFEHLMGRWRALTAPRDAAVQLRSEQAIERCRDVIAGHLRLVARQSARQAAELAAMDARERVQQAAAAAAAAQAEADAQLRKEAEAARGAEEAARAAQRAAEEQMLRQVGGLVRKANGALSDGNTQKAAGLRRAIDEKWPAALAMPTYLARQVQQLDGKLNELKQWKDYAVAPKRRELVEEMESLIGASEQPRALADRIKSLQQEWRTIGKGIASDAPDDWARFQRAAHEAYQPCLAYFEAQSKLRQENLEKRQALLERLAAFEAAQQGENPDRRLLARVLREAPQEWRQYFPVERAANRAVQTEFEGSMKRLQANLDAWYAHNVADKQALANRARQLLALDDSREAIEGVKGLQMLWKQTGPAPNEQDRSLWSEFRELCDAVYQKRQQAFAEYSAALEAAKVKALALCAEAERVGALSGAELHAAASALPELQTAFEALDEMPRADARALHDRFARAVASCEAQIAQQHLRDAERAVEDLFEAGRHVRAYQWAVAQHAEASQCESLKQAAETFIASVQRWPKGGLQAVKESLASTGSASDADGEVREKALRRLCIRGEIRSETPTAPEDEALRREYQVQRLVRGMGQGNHADDGDWDEMQLEWIRIGAIPPELHESLQGRFLRCLAKRPARGPQRSAFQGGEATDNRDAHGSRAKQGRRGGREGPHIATAR
ncbi:MAG: DUF349 domain-containing protein [Steroidobacteraceae bacterium]|jgi:hypothetical protein